MTNNFELIKYPDPFASNKQKKDKSYGHTFAKMIANQWFRGQLSARREWIDKMRSYSRGEQCTNNQKRTIEGKKLSSTTKSGEVEAKTHKIDYTPLRMMPTLKDIVVNSIDESLFKPKAQAIDRTAINKKKDYLAKLDKEYYSKELTDIIGAGIGVNITPKDLPKSESELQTRKLEFKPRIELAHELLIQNVMMSEKFEAIKDKIDEDIFDLGIGVGRRYTDYTEGIKLKYVDVYNYIHSSFQMDDGRDITYHGVMESDIISNVLKQSGGYKFTQEELDKIKKYALGNKINTYDGIDPYNEEEDDHRVIEYLSFSCVLAEKRVFKKKVRNGKTLRLIERTHDVEEYNPKNRNRKQEIPYNIWYEGLYIPEADILIKWEKIPNQAEAGINKPICPFVVYAPRVKKKSEKGAVRFDSMVQRAIPIIDDIHRDWFKFQQLKMELRPNTVTISPRVLNNTMLNGEKVDPKLLLDLYFGRGLLLADDYNDDGEKVGTPISERNGGINNSAIGLLSAEFTNNYNRLRQFLGINELRDGTTKPNSKTSVTVQKLLLASSNNATNHIVKASFSISLEFASGISASLYDIMTTKALKNRYVDIIGTDNVELLDELKKYPLSKFAIYIDFKPDNEERIAFEQSLINAEAKGEINSAQYNQARNIQNTKSATKYLFFVIEDNIEKAEKRKIINIKSQAEANAQQSVLTEQTKQQTVTVKYNVDKQKMLLESQIKMQEAKNNALLDELKAQEQHKRNIELKSMELNIKQNLENTREEAKKERENQRGTIQSKLIDQRKTGKEPIDFENKVLDIFANSTLPIQEDTEV